MSDADLSPVVLDGHSLEIADLVRLARDPRVAVRCDGDALAGVQRCRAHVEQIVREYEQALAGGAPLPRVYGVTTGFGEFKRKRIAPQQFEKLQQNILLSHAVGVGDNASADDAANYFSAEVIRATLALRLNAFLKGHSGIRVEMLECIERMLNRGVVPLVPTRGSVGSSGDLCPLAHLFVVLLGHGRYYVVKSPEDLARPPREYQPASALPAELGVDALPVPSFKEGLALTNGATFCAAQLALAVHDAEALADAADAAAAMALEAVCGRTRALDPRVHAARGMEGQIESAANLRALLAGSKLVDRCDDVQDPYSLRCAPQVHGASRDTIAHARRVAERELNAATDNPLFFPESGPPWDVENFAANRPESFADVHAFSAGNFHGQPLGLAADFLAIAVAELANISERRTQMLLDEGHNRGLPANLIAHRGLNSGYMIAQYCAAGLVSENKVLAHPASVDSIPTSSNVEDHVAMSSIAARKLRQVVANAQAVLAIELLVAAQAIEWRVGLHIDPNAASDPDRDRAPDPSRDREGAVRSAAPPGATDGRVGSPRSTGSAPSNPYDLEAECFEIATAAGHRPVIAEHLGVGTRAAYLAVRAAAAAMLADRVLDGDIAAVRRAVADGRLAVLIRGAIESRPRP